MGLSRVWVWVGVTCWFFAAPGVRADVRLARIFGDNMVLQQRRPVPVWGTADAGERVRVEFRGQKATTTADEDGNWRVVLKPMPAGGPFQMTVTGKNTIVLNNILVGEVWVASGQSNMEWPVALSNNAEQEIVSANYPQIRLFVVPKAVSGYPRKDLSGGAWQPCTPEAVRDFSAVAYFFARELHRALKVPVGVIMAAWGGTPAESWTSKPTLLSIPSLRYLVENWRNAERNYPQALENYRQRLAEWERAVEQARAEGKPEPKKPTSHRTRAGTCGNPPDYSTR
jgi:sialate O-acetylesterase